MNSNSAPATLSDILRSADKVDLDVLVDYITDSGNGRLSLDGDVCQWLTRAKAGAYGAADIALIEREIREFGGNTVANLFRSMRGGVGSLFRAAQPSGSVAYDEIVRDVAEHLKVKLNKDAATSEVEEGILSSLLLTSFEKMSLEEREAVLSQLGVADAADLAKRGAAAMTTGVAGALLGAVVAYRLSGMVAAASAQALLGKAFSFGAASIAARPLSVLVGPVGWAVTGAWALADMASPAYRVTVPCVVHIAYMRKKAQMGRLEFATPSTINPQPNPLPGAHQC